MLVLKFNMKYQPQSHSIRCVMIQNRHSDFTFVVHDRAVIVLNAHIVCIILFLEVVPAHISSLKWVIQWRTKPKFKFTIHQCETHINHCHITCYPLRYCSTECRDICLCPYDIVRDGDQLCVPVRGVPLRDRRILSTVRKWIIWLNDTSCWLVIWFNERLLCVISLCD